MSLLGLPAARVRHASTQAGVIVACVDYPLVVAIPGSSDQLVLTDYMGATPDRGNLARVREDGTEAWRVVPRILSQDTWTTARIEGERIIAYTWSGWDVVLDLDTGRELDRVFVK